MTRTDNLPLNEIKISRLETKSRQRHVEVYSKTKEKNMFSFSAATTTTNGISI